MISKIKNIFFDLVAGLIGIITLIISYTMSVTIIKDNFILNYIVFEAILGLLVCIYVLILVRCFRERAIVYWQTSIIWLFVFLSIGAGGTIYYCQDNSLEIILAMLSAIIGFPSLIEYLFKYNLNLMPVIYSKNIQYKKYPIIDVSKDSKIEVEVRNFDTNDASAALLGIFTKAQWKNLKKSTWSWRTDYYIGNIDQKDAIFVYDEDQLNYESIPSHGKSKKQVLPLKEILSKNSFTEGELYIVYIDIFNVLHKEKFEIKSTKKRY